MPCTSYQNMNAHPFFQILGSLEESMDQPGNPLADFLSAQGLPLPKRHQRSSDQDFIPQADLFDTLSSFIVHISLPGAKKEDIGINYDVDTNELQISGVVHRNANEELINSLVVRERKIGAFERKIKLGTRGQGRQGSETAVAVDPDHITARLENGVLEVIVPKREKEVTEKKKVQID